MSKKRKKYLVTTDNSEAFACSLVTSPAVEETFVAFNEEKPLIEKFADEKKHMVTGVVAIPNKPIYRRNDDGEEYDIVFSAEAIEKMAKDYLKNYRQHEVTLQHQEDADGVYLVEQWIKHDMYRDKSAVIGLSEDLPVGSWIQTYYVDSNDVWQRIESGELQGFSLECMLGLEEFKSQISKNDNNMEIETNDMGFWNKMKEVLAEVFSKKEGDIEPQTDEVELEEQAPSVEPQNEPTVEPQEAPKVEEPTETKVEEKEAVVEPQNEPNEEPKVEEPNPLEEVVKNLQDELKALKDANSELQNKVKELGKKPSAKPLNTNAKPSAADTYSQWRSQMGKYLNGGY